ncbi:hypothetical protein HMPREF3156_00504 [Neisseria sp. HMSC06F02]|nr:hypothetical protein HMPREF3156_00504 [Neisseria sp. HMSC06F02]
MLNVGFKVCATRRWGLWRSHACGWWRCRLRLAGYNRKKVSAAISVKMTVFHSVILGMIL